MQTKEASRSRDRVHLVREEIDIKGNVRVIEAWMPSGKGWGAGNKGAIDWINLNIGWRSYDEYMAEETHLKAEEARIKAEEARMEAEITARLAKKAEEAEVKADKPEVVEKKEAKEADKPSVVRKK